MSNNNRASLLKQHMAMTNARTITSSNNNNTPNTNNAHVGTHTNPKAAFVSPQGGSHHQFDRSSSVSRLAQSASRALKARQAISFIQRQQSHQQQQRIALSVTHTKHSSSPAQNVMNTMSSSSSSDGSSSYESREEGNSNIPTRGSNITPVSKYNLSAGNNEDEVEERYAEIRDEPIDSSSSSGTFDEEDGEGEDDGSTSGSDSDSSRDEEDRQVKISSILRNKMQLSHMTSPIVPVKAPMAENCSSRSSINGSVIRGVGGTESDHSTLTSPPTPVATNRCRSNTIITHKRSKSPAEVIQEEAPLPLPPPLPVFPPPPQPPQQQAPTAIISPTTITPTCPPLHEGQTMKRFEHKLSMPGQKIKDLLTVIAIKPTGPRKMNACGAIKTLSSIPANRIRLSWTRGVIPTLSGVLNDDQASVVEKQRSVSTLLNLVQPKQNQVIIFHSPGFVQGISNGLTSKCYKTNYTSSQCVDILAKNDDNKYVMFDQFPLINAISSVISNPIPPTAADKYDSGTNSSANPYDENYSSADNASAIVDNLNASHNVSKADYHGLALTARLRCLLTLRHLSRVKDIAYKFSRNIHVMTTILSVSGNMDASANAVCIAIFADLTRHPHNSLQLVYHVSGFLQALVTAAKSPQDSKCRQYACYALLNLSCTMGCRQELAITRDLIYTLSECGLHSDYPDEQIAAIGALKNISNDPSNFIHLSNTTKCFSTLIFLSERSNNTNEMLQYLACDALATLSNWIAASALAGMNVVANRHSSSTNSHLALVQSMSSDMEGEDGCGDNVVFTKEMMKPKLAVQPWNQWD